MDKYIGRLLDNRYEILEIIGTGGMAVVYKSLDHRLNRMVAIKILKDEFFQDEEFRRRFHAESQAVAMLSHPNIVSVYDVSASGDADYIVMELIEGITLKQYMEKKGVLNWRETLHFSMQIAKALEHAHSRGIIHRDIKPHNVMILKNGSAKVADFGIARMMSSTNTLTKEALGSVHYISPEQAKGGRVDNRSDIYSLGVVMYEMMTGRPPYDGESPVAIALKHINGGAAMPSVINPNIPGGLEQIIMKAMAVDPARRYTSATEMLYDLEEFRKNPSILFYHDLDLRNQEPVRAAGYEGQGARRTAPRNTAERVAGVRQDSGSRPRQTTGRTPVPVRKTENNRPEEQPNRNKKTTIAIIAGAGVVFLILFIIAVNAIAKNMFGSDPTVEVPSFVGEVFKDLDPADYPDLQLVDSKYEYSEDYENGKIMRQDPLPHSQVAVGSTVNFVVSMGVQTENMPDLTRLTVQNAKDMLAPYDLNLRIVEELENSDDVPEGKIIRTEPTKGEPLLEGATVTLWVSEGSGKGLMPQLKDKTFAQASDELTNLNLNLRISQEKENSDTVEKGKVIRSEPAYGQEVKKGDSVTLWISEGPKQTEVPQVWGMDIVKALDILERSKLKGDYVYIDSDKPKDEVVTQSEKVGTMVDEGTTIHLEISNGPTEPTTPPTEASKTVNYTIKNLPANETTAYTLAIYKDGAPYLDNIQVQPGTTEIPVVLEGRGVIYFDLYINGEYYDAIRVDFG